MALLTPQTTSRTALDFDAVAQAAAGGGDTFANDGTQLIEIVNAGVGAITLTVASQKTFDGQALANKTYTITNGTHHYVIGPFDTTIYNDASGLVHLTYSGVTSVSVLILKPGSP